LRLSKKGEYSLRAMIYLSQNYGRDNVQIQEISENEKIPEKFLSQILLQLKKAGFVQSKRGAGGGYFLIRHPKDITFAEVVRIIDGPLAPLGCVSKWAHESCEREKNCRLQSIMFEVRNAVSNILENITFNDACQ
jgi:Rrf2 family protein